jgi:hypothetical protein
MQISLHQVSDNVDVMIASPTRSNHNVNKPDQVLMVEEPE